MNKDTKRIMALFGIDADAAYTVQEIMDTYGIDYSECTTREFNEAARDAYAEYRSEAA